MTSSNTNSLDDALTPLWERQPPDFVNDLGVKWWLDRDLTGYATKGNLNGTKLDYQVFVVEKPNGYRTRIILDEKREPVYEHQQLEAVATRIDMMKIVKERF